jgi:hypothetical protein
MRIDIAEITELLQQAPLFTHLQLQDLETLAILFQMQIFQDGENIFNEGDSADAIYILGDGRIRLQQGDADEQWVIASLTRGDIFGEEALLYDDPRYYQAVAEGVSYVFRLNVEDYLAVDQDLPDVEDRLEVLIRSRRLSTKITIPWLQVGEFVKVITRRHAAILWFKLIKASLVGLAVLLVSLLIQWQWLPQRLYGWILFAVTIPVLIAWLIWTFFDWRNDYFIMTNKRVAWIEKVAFLYESRKEAPLSTIMSVGIERSRIGSLFDFSDVVVLTYVGTIRLPTLGRADPIADLIEAFWHRSESVSLREEALAMSRKLHEKLDLAWRADEETQPIDHQKRDQKPVAALKEPDFLAWLFSDFIRLRYERDGAITYRKHWFLLVKKIWFLILLLIFTFGIILVRISGRFTFIPMTSMIVLSLIAMFIIFVWMVYHYADWRNDIFKITLDQIIDIDRKPLGKIRRRAAPLENVLSIEYERLGIWGFLLNFGTVYITVGNTRLTFDHVYNPSEVQQDIFYRMGERLENIRQFEIESERERVSEWIASYHRKTRK